MPPDEESSFRRCFRPSCRCDFLLPSRKLLDIAPPRIHIMTGWFPSLSPARQAKSKGRSCGWIPDATMVIGSDADSVWAHPQIGPVAGLVYTFAPGPSALLLLGMATLRLLAYARRQRGA